MGRVNSRERVHNVFPLFRVPENIESFSQDRICVLLFYYFPDFRATRQVGSRSYSLA